MAIIQQPDALSLSGNLKKFIVSSGETVSFVLKDGSTVLLDATYEPGSDSRVTIDVQDIVESRLSFLITHENFYQQQNVVKTFTAVIDGTEYTFRAIRAGVANLGDTPGNWLKGNFLTWQPTAKPVTYYSPEWLTYYAVEACTIKLKATFPDNTVQNFTLGACEAGKAFTVNLQYAVVSGLLGQVYPSYYEVWAEKTGGTRLTYIQRYLYSEPKSEQEQWFLFENSLGGLDTIRAYGDTDFEGAHEHKIASIDGVSSEYRIDTQRFYNKNTGYLDEYERRWLLDFFPSRTKSVYFNSAFRKIVVSESDVKYAASDLPSSYNFKYRFADDSAALLNLIRNEDAIPADIVIPDIDSPDFSLPPRLSEYPRVTLSEGVILPAFDPFSEMPKVTSFGAIRDEILSKVIHPIYQVEDIIGLPDALAEISGSSHSHPNKTIIDQLTQGNLDVLSKLSLVEGNLKIDANAYSTGELSAYGIGSGGSSGGGVDLLQAWTDYDATKDNWAVKAGLLVPFYNDATLRLSALEGGAALSLSTVGSGNSIASITKSGTVLTVTKANFAELDVNGKILSSQLPSYVDDVLEYVNLAAFPATGETGKIYIAQDSNKTYRWSGTTYVEISASLALGETSSTAYRGDRGKTAYDHSQLTGNPHGTTFAQIVSRPTTIAGYGITDAYTKTEVNSALTSKLDKSVFDDLFEKVEVSTGVFAIKAKYNFYGVGEISAYGLGSGGSGGGGISMMQGWTIPAGTEDYYAPANLVVPFYNDVNSRLTSLESGSALTVNTTGAGNAITSISKAGTVITATKGATFSLSGHTHSYLPLSGGTLTGTLTANNHIILPRASHIYDTSTSDSAILVNSATIVGVGDIKSDTTRYLQLRGTDVKFREATSGTEYGVWHAGNFTPGNYSLTSHTHPISSITNLQTSLDGKASLRTRSSMSDSYRRFVIGVIRLDGGASAYSRAFGTITMGRVNGVFPNKRFDFSIQKKYNVEAFEGNVFRYNSFNTFRLCKFLYNGVLYGGFDIYVQEANITSIDFIGQSPNWVVVEYYNTSSNTVINSEINNSLVEMNYEAGSFYANGDTIYSSGNLSPVTTNTAQTITGEKTFDANITLGVNRYIKGTDNYTGIWNVDDKLWRFGSSSTGSVSNIRSEKVGIGIDAPSEKLHVVGNILTTGSITAPLYQSGTYNWVSKTGGFHSGIDGQLTGGMSWYDGTGTSANIFRQNNLLIVSRGSNQSLTIDKDSNVSILGELLATGGLRVNQTSYTGIGISLRGTHSAVNPVYGLMFASIAAKGSHGAVTGDYATYFTMDSVAGRGWIFTNNSSSTGGNVASIDNTGGMTIKNLTLTAQGTGTDASEIVFTRPTYNYIRATGTGSLNFCINNDSPSSINSVLVLASNGNVGVGKGFTNNTTAVTAQLHVRGNILSTGEITAYVASDRRLKENIKPIISALDYINKLNPVSYNWNARAKELNPMKSDSLDYGLIAQEVENVLPGVVHGIFDDKYKSIDYIKLIPIMIAAIKELKQKVNKL